MLESYILKLHPRPAVVQLLSHVQFFATPWPAARQSSLSFTISWSLLEFISIELVMLSNHLILCCPLLLCLQSFTASQSFPISQFFTSGGQSIGVSATASVLPMNIRGWFPLGLIGLISLQSQGFSRVFSASQFKGISSSVLSPLYGPTHTPDLLSQKLLWSGAQQSEFQWAFQWLWFSEVWQHQVWAVFLSESVSSF